MQVVFVCLYLICALWSLKIKDRGKWEHDNGKDKVIKLIISVWKSKSEKYYNIYMNKVCSTELSGWVRPCDVIRVFVSHSLCVCAFLINFCVACCTPIEKSTDWQPMRHKHTHHFRQMAINIHIHIQMCITHSYGMKCDFVYGKPPTSGLSKKATSYSQSDHWTIYFE